MDHRGRYLKQHTEALVKDVGLRAACRITGKSKATLGRYYSTHPEHAERFMPVNAVALLEAEAAYPHVTGALAELGQLTLSRDDRQPNAPRNGSVNADVIALSQRFAMLMSEYHQAIGDGRISINEARRLLRETVLLQQVLLDMKLNLENECA